MLQALVEDLSDFAAELARETPAQAVPVKSARLAASSYLLNFVDSSSVLANGMPSRRRRSSADGTLALQRRRRSSVGDSSKAAVAFTLLRDSYAGAITASRRVNATALLVAASDEAAELDWLLLSGGSAASVAPGSEEQVIFALCHEFITI